MHRSRAKDIVDVLIYLLYHGIYDRNEIRDLHKGDRERGKKEMDGKKEVNTHHHQVPHLRCLGDRSAYRTAPSQQH